MIKQHRIMLAVASVMSLALPCSAFGQPAVHGYTELAATFDELVERQSLGLEAMYFGGQGILEDGKTSITPYAFLGFYGYEAIMGGFGASVQTEALLPIGIGAGFGVMDADLRSYTLGLNAQKRFDRSTWATLLLQGAVGYQRKSDDRGKYYAIYLKPAEWPETPQDLVLFDKLSWYSAYVHAVFEARWSILKPLLDIGWLATHYRYSGYECDRDCLQPGGSASGNGMVYGLTFGVGVSLDIGSLQVFGGIKGSDAGVIFPVSLALMF
jgi:hypothetical protein